MSNYNVDTLENKIIVEAREAIKSLENIIGYVDKTKTAVDSMKSATGLKNLDAQAKQSTSSLKKMQLATKGLKTALNFTGLIYGFKKVFGFLTDSLENSINYIETLNLFEVSMGKTLNQYGNLNSESSKYYTKALKFQNELNQAFGTNIEETMRYQALYNQMAESMGINDSASYIISENLTKLGIDLASLFNATKSDTMEALRAGVLAGQTKPLRNYGLDVTQQTLSPIAQELGITKSVKQLSQAEKMILRYIAVLKQASSAHGDFAKTIESPANQLKVFKQQFAELKTAVGNFFQGLLGQILPYINGILMAIKEVIKAIAVMFGIKVTSANSNLVDQTGIEDLESGLSGAVGSAKELKLQLMGFDEINNITTDKGSGGSVGGTSVSGVDSRLLDAMKEYDNLMSDVKMKATDIRDNIMDWLGFTKKINPLTGEVSWELKEGWTNLKKILTVIKTLIGLYLATKLLKLIGNLRNFFTILKTGKATGLTPFVSGLTGLKNAFTKTTEGVGKHAKEYKTLNENAVKATLGIAGLTASLYNSYDSMRDLVRGTKDASDAYLQLGISIGGAVGSGALIGSTFGPVGTIIGGIAGLVASATTAIITYNEEQKKLAEAEALADMFDNQGRSMDSVLTYYTKIHEATTNFTDIINDSSAKIKDNNKQYEETATSIENLTAKLNSAYYEVNSQDFTKIKEDFSSLATVVNDNNAEMVSSLITNANHMKELGIISKEETDSMIDDIVRYQTMQGDKTAELKRQMVELDLERQRGNISTEEYTEKVLELTSKMDELNGQVSIHTSEYKRLIDNYNSNKIDMKNAKEAEEFVNSLKTTMESTITEMNNSNLALNNMIDTMIASTTDEELINSLENYRTKANEAFELDVEKIQGDYKGTFGVILAQMLESGAYTAEEMQTVKNTINDILKDTGNIDLSGQGKETFESLVEGMIESKDKNLPILIVELEKYGFNLKEKYMSGIQFTEAEQKVISSNWTEASQIKSGDFVWLVNQIAKDGLEIRNAHGKAIEFTPEEKLKMAQMISNPYNMTLAEKAKILKKIVENGGEIRNKHGEVVQFTQDEINAIEACLNKPIVSWTESDRMIDATEKYTQNAIDTLIYNIYAKTSECQTAGKDLGDNTGDAIIESLEANGPEVEKVSNELAEIILDQLDTDEDMRKEAVECVKAYLQGLSEEKQRELLKQVGIENAEEVIKGLKQGNLAEDVGINIIKGLRTGLQNNYWQGVTLSTAYNFASNILNKFKATFGIHSPSKETKQFGLYLLEGLGLGIKNGEKNILNSVSDFSKNVLEEFSVPLEYIRNGISIKQSELSVDTNQFIDYGAIEGNINSKFNFTSNISQIPRLVYDAVMQGMKNSNIQVDIKAETEEGVIVKKASQGFKEHVIQTGELPFPIPI